MQDRRTHDRQRASLASALAAYGIALAAGVLAAYQVAGRLAPSVGLVAAVPAALLAFVVVAAVALVLVARADAARARR